MEETIKKQSTIAALSSASILHDPTLVEDLSDLRLIPRTLGLENDDGAEPSVSGSVVITRSDRSTNELLHATENKETSNIDKNVTRSITTMADIEDKFTSSAFPSSPRRPKPRILSMASSHYSEEEDNSKNDEDNDKEEKSIYGNKSDDDETNEDGININKRNSNNMENLESVLDNEISNIKDDIINHDNQSGDVLENTDDELDMEYSDSDFEDNLEQRMLHLDVENERSHTVGDVLHIESNEQDYYTNSDKQSNISREDDIYHQDNIHDTDDSEEIVREVEEEEEFSEEEAEEDEDYQPLPPPQELDPEKLYALYAFNGPDPSHCKLDQDEPCVLLNDEDTYWWLVKRCRDNNIGFAPAEILETFPERLARLNCWKNENMTSSTVNSVQSIEMINQNERERQKEQQEQLNIKKNSSLKLPYQDGKNDKSVSFNDIISYADRYIEDSTETDTQSGNDEEANGKDTLDTKLKEDKEITRYNHVDKFTNEVMEYKPFNEIDENSDVVSDVSFNTGYTQPLNMVKIRESKSIKNIHNEIVIKGSPKRHEEINKWSDIEGLGIKGFKNTDDRKMINANPDELVINEENNKNKDSRSVNNESINNNENPIQLDIEQELTDNDGVQKIFEAPVAPFGKDKSNIQNKIKPSTSDYSISTIGEFSPSSSEWTNDSPNLKNPDDVDVSNQNTKKDDLFNESVFNNGTIPSTRAVQDISKLVDEPISEDINILDQKYSLLDEITNNGKEKSIHDSQLTGKYTSGESIHNTVQYNKEGPLSTSPIPNISSNNSSVESVSSVERDLKMYVDDIDLKVSTTSVTSNTSAHKNQAPHLIQQLDSPQNPSSVANMNDTVPNEVVHNNVRELRSAFSDTYKHPVVQEIYQPILSKIDILLTKIDDIIQQ